MRKIDKAPPPLTGSAAADLKATHDYLVWLVEQINWILTIIDQNGGT